MSSLENRATVKRAKVTDDFKDFKFLVTFPGQANPVGFIYGGFTHHHAEKRLRKALEGEHTDARGVFKCGKFPSIQTIGHGARLHPQSREAAHAAR